MENKVILESSLLDAVKGATLFYPCSGMDLFTPVEIFSSHIDDFWLVDRGYFAPGHQDTRGSGYDAPADEQPPVLKGKSDYEFIEKSIEGPPSWNWHDRDIEPCLVTEKYLHRPTESHITVRRRRGYGYSAFRKEKDISPLGVFFYRGDSMGEGGSGNIWFTKEHLAEICYKLVDKGLIVTDSCGSIYRGIKGNWGCFDLGAYSRPDSMTPDYILEEAKKRSFSQVGCQFNCVGYLGHWRGPTLVWQVKKVSRIPRNPGPYPLSKYQEAPRVKSIFR